MRPATRPFSKSRSIACRTFRRQTLMQRERRADVAVVTAALCVAALSPAAGAVSSARVTDAREPLEEIVVTASLRPEPVQHFPASTTVLDASTLHAAGLQHFEDVLGLVPNLNWAG